MARQDISSASEPAEMADAIVRIVGDRPLRDRLGANARDLVERNYSVERVGKDVLGRLPGCWRASNRGRRMRSLLITGGAGFIGVNTARFFLKVAGR